MAATKTNQSTDSRTEPLGAEVCKTFIRRFDSDPRLQHLSGKLRQSPAIQGSRSSPELSHNLVEFGEKCSDGGRKADGISETVTIRLTQGYFALISAEDFERVSAHSWHAQVYKSGRVYAKSKIRQRQTFLHRFLLNAPDGVFVDHEDGDGLNCTRLNIRLCTHRQNMANSRARGGGSSRFKGVHRSGTKWRAMTRSTGQRFSLGMFDSEEQAARAYDAKARELHGEFAYLNFPVAQEPR